MLGISHKMGICSPFSPYSLVLTLPPTYASPHILFWQNCVICICQNILGQILLRVHSLYIFLTLFPCSFLTKKRYTSFFPTWLFLYPSGFLLPECQRKCSFEHMKTLIYFNYEILHFAHLGLIWWSMTCLSC